MPEPVDGPMVVALAGGTGSGKSTLARALDEAGAAVIDADVVGHETLDQPAVRRALVEEFGEGILADDGIVSRPSLGAIVFGDAARLGDLNRIVHPPLVAEIVRRVDRLRQRPDVRLIVIDAALWPQFEPRPPVDLFVMITAPRPVRRARVVERDGIDEATADRRLDRQADLDAFLGDADAVLHTVRSAAEARTELFELLDARLPRPWRGEP